MTAELTNERQDTFNNIERLGTEAAASLYYGMGTMADVESAYRELNRHHDPAIEQAFELELAQQGFPSVSITGGDISFDPQALTEEQRTAGSIRLAVEQFTGENADRLRAVAALDPNDHEGEISVDDIRAALLSDDFTNGEKASLAYIYNNIASISDETDLSLLDSWDVDEEDLLEFAAEEDLDSLVFPASADRIDEEQRALLAGETGVGGVDYTVVPYAPPFPALENAPTQYTVQPDQGYWNIAEDIYRTAFDRAPSDAETWALTQRIAEINGNDVNYGNGPIHPGQVITAMSRSEMEAFLASLGN